MTSAAEMYEYQYLSTIVDEFEKAALKSQTREGALVFALPALAASKQIVSSGQETIRASSGGRIEKQKKSATSTGASGEASATFTPGTVTSPEKASCAFPDLVDPENDFKGLEVNTPGVSVDGQADFSQLIADTLGEEFKNVTSEQIKEWLEECVPCDFRISFDWQLQPTNLLEPFNQMFDQIEQSIDMFQNKIDPFRSLKGLCKLLDALKGQCIPDLIMMLMSLKMLLGKYMQFGLDIKIDWTTVIGPLLKLILDAVLAIFNLIKQIVMAPIDCTISMLDSINDLINEAASTFNTAYAAGQTIGDNFSANTDENGNTSVAGIGTDWDFQQSPEVGYAPGDVRLAKEADESSTFAKVLQEQYPDFPTPDTLSSRSSARGFGGDGSAAKAGVKIPTGLGRINATDTFDDYLNDPRLKDVDVLGQVTLAMREVKLFIDSLFSNLQFGVSSLNEFITGGLSFQLQSAGAIISVLDLISTITMLIKMFQNHGKETDWCKLLEEQPGLLQEQLAIRFPSAEVTIGDDKSISVTQGNRTGTIAVAGECVAARGAATDTDISNWIAQLEGSM